MSFFFKKPAVRVLARHTTRHPYFAGEHLFFQVKDSTGVLRMELSRDPDCTDVMQDTYLTLTIKGQPLAFIQTSGCPTCQSLLGAGYGLPKDTPELRQAADAIAAPFSGLEEALERLSPIIGLLPPQYYLLSLVNCCPTDGNGHFFWDIPNEYTSSPATAQTYDPETYTCLPVFPRFLHPTQSTETYDREQAERYRQRIREGKPLPPALAYSAFEYLSILLDGHHRACACALEGVLLPCLILSPARFVGRDDHWQVVWPDEEKETVPGISIPLKQMYCCTPSPALAPPPRPGRLFTRRWEPEYRQAAARFPDTVEMGALALYQQKTLTMEGVLALPEPENALIAPVLLSYFCRQPEVDAKQLALSFSGKEVPFHLRKMAFHILAGIKQDPEIEDLFVDFLVECEDPQNPLRIIADHYWDTI